jgi:hypothetical protein
MDGDMESELYRSGGILSVGEPFSLAGNKEEQLKNHKDRKLNKMQGNSKLA